MDNNTNTPQKKEITFRIRYRWWLWPYIILTRLGVIIGLPLNRDIIMQDIAKGLYIEDIKK